MSEDLKDLIYDWNDAVEQARRPSVKKIEYRAPSRPGPSLRSG